MTALDDEKRAMRLDARRALAGFGPIRGSASVAACEHLIAGEVWYGASAAMAYLADGLEMDLDSLWAARTAASPVLAAPRLDWDSKAMSPRAVEDPRADTEVRRYAVREPVESRPSLDPATLDLVLVPGLAFDRAGGRLGRGAGYYDRFLPLAPNATLVGVCWSGQLVDRVPTGTQDVRVHMLLTEHGLRRCSPAG